MKRLSKPLLGLISAVAGGLAMLAAVQFSSFGQQTNALPRLNLKDAPINRETRGVTSYAPIIKRAAPAVVNIYSTRIVRLQQRGGVHPFFDDPIFRRFFGPGLEGEEPQNGQPRPRTRREQGLGSGVIVSPDGYILTANHVIEGADEIKVGLASGGREFTAKVIGTDRPTDIAVLKIDATDLPHTVIADSDKLEVGDIVLAIGNPFGVGQTVTMGMVSGVGRTSLGITDYENFIQTDAAINRGNSGGALIDAEGRLVGINTAIFSPSGGNAGIGFAVPVNMARSVMERLIQFGKVTRGYLGVSLQEITPDLASAFRLPDQNGAIVSDVSPNTPASRAGLNAGDVIREVDGRPVVDSAQLRLLISQKAPGTRVNLKVLRGERGRRPAERTVSATLAALPENLARRGPGLMEPDTGNPPAQDALHGVEVIDLDRNSRRQFNVPGNVQGALVTSVDEESNAGRAGLRPGDVIEEIAYQPVRSADDAVRMTSEARGESILLRVRRGQASRYVVVQIPQTEARPEETPR